MKALRALNWFFAAYYAAAFAGYVLGAYTPSPTTVGITLLLSAMSFVWCAESLKE